MVATNVKPGEDLTFKVSGTGQFQPEGQQAEARDDGNGGGAMPGRQPAGRDNRPGGGLGAPIDSDDPLHDYRAVILGVFALVLVMGGAYVVSKSNSEMHAAAAGPNGAVLETREIASTEPDVPRDRNAMLLEAMKEELFQLELDRQRGKVSADEYATAKAALDQTIKRALTRANERS